MKSQSLPLRLATVLPLLLAVGCAATRTDPASTAPASTAQVGAAQVGEPFLFSNICLSLGTSDGRVVVDADGRAVLKGGSPTVMRLVALDRPHAAPMRYGDSVALRYLSDGCTMTYKFLTAQTPTAANTKGPASVSFVQAAEQPKHGTAQVWTVYDSQNPKSKERIRTLTGLSFRSAAFDYPPDSGTETPLPAMLSAFFPAEPGAVSTVNHTDKDELWNVKSLPNTGTCPFP